MVYKMDFLRFLNDAAEKTSKPEKAILPGAEKNGWECCSCYHLER